MIARGLWAAVTVIALFGCATADTSAPRPLYAEQLTRLLPAAAILLGEQHDAPDHQRIHRFVLETLATQHSLAALALEMANQGRSTEQLDPQAGEEQVRTALQWDNQAWPWAAYGPVVMAAVRAGVPVIGANLANAQLRDAMGNSGLDALLPGPALKAQQQNIRLGHCALLPESQILPMTRIQIARDVAMAQTIAAAARPGKTVLLLAGSGHVNRSLGVALHLPPGFKVKTVHLLADKASIATEDIAAFDQIWVTEPAPAVDYCANFTAQRAGARPATIQKQ